MKRRLAGLCALAVLAAACTVEPIEDPGIGGSALTTIVYASNGSILAEWHAEEDRILVGYEELPRHLVDAVVAIEDQRFWVHNGVDPRAVARALSANLEAGQIVQGGSTITQQYLKNVLLSPEVTLDRKLEEASLAVRLEATLTKEQILERYLNTVYFGKGAYGVGTAADRYFGKRVSGLTLGESALLAGLLKAPATYDPYLNPEAALSRRRVVLQKMEDLGWASSEEAAAADQETLTLQPFNAGQQARYPYFVEEVKRRLLVDPALGDTPTDRYNALFRGGLRIHTTIDPAVQEAAEAALASVLPEEGPSGGLAAIDPRTGHVLAIVGGRDFYDVDDPIAQFNLATQGRRQPGSAFKPFTLAAAVSAGIELDTVYAGGDSVTIITNSGPWLVENYNLARFPDLSLLEATVFSVNVVYAQVIDQVGPDRVVQLAEAAGIKSDLEPFHSVALGSQEVSVLDLSSAYGTFAAGGIHVDPIFVTTIKGHDSRTIHETAPAVTQVVEPWVAEAVTEALTEVVRRGTGQQARIGRPIAGKTGTSQDHRDAWFVGFTPQLVAAVWVGFAREALPMVAPSTPYTITGGTWPAQIWSRFASGALSGVPYGQLPTSEGSGAVAVEIDLSTGFLAGPLCPRSYVQRVHLDPEAVPTVVCPIHNPPGIVEIGAGVVPAVDDRPLEEAVRLLTAAGYLASVDWADGGPLAPGTVFDQVPSAGAPAQEGSTVRLTVAGPAPWTVVPAILGYPSQQAVTAIEALGVTAEVIIESESDPEDAERRAGMVWAQYPAQGTPLPETVT
ncbi:MAG: PBP1A family penicillin-binding protein, partial [Acidimicrobiia bacterium]